MARSGTNYKRLLQSLLPQGKFWPRRDGAALTEFLDGAAQEYARIDSRADELVNESYPSATEELIAEWEKEYAIPENGVDLKPTLAGRQQVLAAKFISIGQQDAGYFEDIATKLGYTITIVEHKPLIAGAGLAGDECGPQVNFFYWHAYINVPADIDIDDFEWNISQLIVDIESKKPAHTIVLFDFYNVGFGYGFGRGFNSKHLYDNSWQRQESGRGFSNGFANAYDYDGVNYTGGFGHGFNLGFDAHFGGGFNYNEFGDGFFKPA